MQSILIITCIGLSVGMMGTGLGGLITFLMKTPSKKFLSFILGISGGLMLSIVCFDLLPEAFDLGQLYVGIIGILIGVGTIIGLDEVLDQKVKVHSSDIKNDFIKTGILLGLGVAMHNFPEGLAIGSGFMATKELGIGISIVIALHNMPEGISMGTPMSIGGLGRWRIFLYTIFAGIPMGIGAFIGAFLGEISKNFIAFCLAFAGGTMLYITCGELIPKSQSLKNKNTSNLGFVLGFIMGVILTEIL
ncbi:ZIP family metal transporter [Clostridiaceae bacterium 35-E11]